MRVLNGEETMSERDSGTRLERIRKDFVRRFWGILIGTLILRWVVYPIGEGLFGKPWPYIFIAMAIAVLAWAFWPRRRDKL